MTSENELKHRETTLADIEQLGIWASIASLGYVFWVVGAMEMVERLAYYGVRIVSSLYATRPTSQGGLGVTMATFGSLLMSWNLVQSLIPVFTGGLSDRYGYKETIFLATVLKAVGYVLMGLLPSYWGFFAGAMFLATGTATFKPGLQGTLVKATNRQNSSMAWGIFYQTVNIGGWIGPLIALNMRTRQWSYVFYANAAIICLNFLLLLTYREPGKSERLARRRLVREGKEKQTHVVLDVLHELKKPHLAIYLFIFSFWWFMFPMIWDVLPKYVDDWVDTSVIVTTLFGADGTQSRVIRFLLGMTGDGRAIQPEGIVNINSAMIMIFCFVFAAISAKMRATNSMLAGTVLISVALCVFGLTNAAWFSVLAVLIFAIGEMLASPKYLEFLGNIAPVNKKAMWIGFTQVPMLIGMTIEGKLGPQLYHLYSSKDVFARQMIEERRLLSPEDVTEEALPVGEAFDKLVALTGESPGALTNLLYQSHSVGMTWYVFAAVGVISALMIYLYGRWILTLVSRGKEVAE